jgi:glycosyltransferase involved in cell wall biosynthesis
MSFTQANDVSAVVLTMGEPTTRKAIDSLRRQTMLPREVIVVRGKAPFHKALNTGAAQVKTPFFVQVDADMILDPHCIAALRGNMSRRIGIVVARLRDALIEQVVGVKLFRSKCFESEVFQNSISPDTDFVNAIARRGWETVYIGSLGADQWATFGEHRPTYTFSYTYHKSLREGRRYRHRRSISGLQRHLGRLELSRNPSALVAQIGLAHGIFLNADWDLHDVRHYDESFARLDAFLRRPQTNNGCTAAALPPVEASAAESFRCIYRLGHDLGDAGNSQEFLQLLRHLDHTGSIGRAWILKIALCHGLLSAATEDANIEADFRVLQDFLGVSEPA